MSSPSPLDTRPHVFQSGSLIDSKTYEQILSSIYTKPPPPNIKHIKQEQDDNDDLNHVTNEQQQQQRFNQKTSNLQRREQEIQQLTQLIRTTQPTNDNMANVIMQQLDDILQTIVLNDNQIQQQLETSSSLPKNHPYPPINQIGPIKDHDRPYADYGHLNRQTIAQECHFNLQLPHSSSSLSLSSSLSSSSSSNQQLQKSIRLQAKSFAITSWTNVSKESVMNYIKDEFGIEQIQYICIGEEISKSNHQRHLHIQIIFKEKIDRRKPFLDQITHTHCNYQVTHNDCAWNEYIKKGGNYIEFNEFKSTKPRARRQKQWPPSLFESSSSSTEPVHPQHTTTIAAGQERKQTTEEKQRQKETIARHAFHLAKTNVHDALIFMRDNSIANDFLRYSHWYDFFF
jgi:hypothetical protein